MSQHSCLMVYLKWNEDRIKAYTMAEQISRSIGKQHVETALAQVVLWVAKAITLWHHRLYQAILYFGQSATKTIIAEGHWEQQNPRHILRQVTVIFYSVWKTSKKTVAMQREHLELLCALCTDSKTCKAITKNWHPGQGHGFSNLYDILKSTLPIPKAMETKQMTSDTFSFILVGGSLS